MAWSVWLALLLMWVLPPSVQAADIVIRYPRPESNPDERSRYPLRLLELALARSDKDYRIEISPLRMQQGRALLQLEKNEGIDIVSTMTSTEREARLQPIRIPIDKGLIGWRLLLVEKAKQGQMAQLRSLPELKNFSAGQGSDWPDTSIMRANGLPVYGTSNYESLFSMLESGRIDYFPRAVTEIWAEADLHKQRLAVEPGIVLRYPTALYFFVRKEDVQLAADVSAGLEKMIADGSFDRVFQDYFGDMIRRAELRERHVIELKNPLMPDSLPLARKNLWYRD
jgi:ABC-type amino acid transport substrate-binding protein